MTLVRFIYFKGCPNADITREALQTAGVDFEEVEQTSLSKDSPLRNYSSPTILRGEEIVFGSKTGEGGGCSLHVPTAAELKAALPPPQETSGSRKD